MMKTQSYIHHFASWTALIAVQSLAALVLLAAAPAHDQRAPELPPGAEHLQAPPGNKVAFSACAAGVQLYVCRNISTTETPQYAWVFKAPKAELFANVAWTGQIGTHYAGPTWESNSGGKVVAAPIGRATVDPDAIPWLLLETISADGPGPFKKVTYIQRVNTVGGLAPDLECTAANEGEEIGVPYTAEYYFYRAAHH